MRIIAGKAKGRKLVSPGGNSKKHPIRPTSDRCRESLFSILGSELVEDSRVLDLFAGTGALGLEALSRGAREVIFVDNGVTALSLIKKNIQALGLSSCRFFKRDITKGLFFLQKLVDEEAKNVEGSSLSRNQAVAFDLVFLDPPYQKNYCNQVLTELTDNGLLNSGGTVVCEERRSSEFPQTVGPLQLYDNRVYGDTGFWFYRMD